MSGLEIVRCSGFRLGAAYVPAFSIGRRALMGLRFKALSAPEICGILRILSGVQCEPAVRVAGKGGYVLPLGGPASFSRRGSVQKIIRKEVGDAGLRDELCRRLPVHRRFVELGATERIMLGLEICVANGTKVVAFATVGLDPAGVEFILRWAKSSCKSDGVVAIDLFYAESRHHDPRVFDQIVDIQDSGGA